MNPAPPVMRTLRIAIREVLLDKAGIAGPGARRCPAATGDSAGSESSRAVLRVAPHGTARRVAGGCAAHVPSRLWRVVLTCSTYLRCGDVHSGLHAECAVTGGARRFRTISCL